jgi:uncharacterized protein YjbJ (UPF0337 family)
MAEGQPPHGERTRMSPETFTQQWAQIRQHLRGWWDQLTEQDLDQIAGQQDQLVRVIQERYQYLQEHARDEVDQRLQAYQTGGSPMAEAFIAAVEEAASRLTETAEQGQATAAGTSVLDRYTGRPGVPGAALPRHLGPDRPGGGRAARPQPRENSARLGRVRRHQWA